MARFARLRRLRALLPAPRADPPEAELWSRALSAGKATATGCALGLFVLGLTLDDLHLFRASLTYAGVAAAILAYGLLPPFLAQRLVRRARVDAPEVPGLLLESSVTRRRAVLAATSILLVAWLILFSSGMTPRW